MHTVLPFLSKPPLLPEATGDTLWVLVGSPWAALGLWLLGVNLATFLVFGWDKLRSKREGARRVPEKTLFLLAALGGSVGALAGMRVWRHKTLHRSFRLGIPLILALQILLPLGLYVYLHFLRAA